MYSGNIGLYYDLENLIKVMKQFRKGYTVTGLEEKGPRTKDGREVMFAFVGAGSVLDKLLLYSKNTTLRISFLSRTRKRLIWATV